MPDDIFDRWTVLKILKMFFFCRILGKWPNTYTFTKAMAENLIKNNSNGLPMVIYRPAISKKKLLFYC